MSDRECPFTESMAALALGAIPAEDEAGLRAHLDVCPACRLHYEEAKATVLLLAFAPPEAEPPPHLRDRILAAARLARLGGHFLPATRPYEPWRSPGAGRGQLRGWLHDRWRAAAGALAVGWALTLTAALWQAHQLNGRLARLEGVAAAESDHADAEPVLAGTATAPAANARVLTYHDPDRQGLWLSLIAQKLPPLGPGEVYHFWVIYGGGQRRSGGVFIVDRSGSGSVVTWVPADLRIEALGVTREPDGFGTEPRGPRMLFGTWNPLVHGASVR